MSFLSSLNKIQKKISNPATFSKYYYQYYTNLLPVDKKIVLIESFHGQNISDSGLEIAKEILHSYPGQYTIYFASEDLVSHQEYIKNINLNVDLVDIKSRKYARILATAGYIFANTGLPLFFIKRKDQIYMQTWHGTPLKLLGKKMRLGIDSLGLAQHGFLQADYMTQPNDFTKDIIMKDYNLENIYTGKVVMAGYPRNRIFLEPEKGRELKKALGYDNYTLYAYMPTWRGTSARDKNITDYALQVKKIFEELDSYLSDNTIFFVKFHPILRNAIMLDSYEHIKPFPTDVESYDFINCCDVLVTDYSSVFFDYSLTRKPIILFPYDYEEYLRDRGVYMDIKELPFRIVYTATQLGKCIADGEALEDDYSDTEYYRQFFVYDKPDITRKLIDLAFTGDPGDLTILDYSSNKDREFRVFLPKRKKDLAELATLAKTTDANSIVWLYRGWFKNHFGEYLHDLYNDSFTYIITSNVIPMTFGEFFLNKLKINRIVSRLHLRDIRRTLPNLKVDPDFIQEYGCLDLFCKPDPTAIQECRLIKLCADQSGRLTIQYELPSGYQAAEAVVLLKNSAILSRRILSSSEIVDSEITYSLKVFIEKMEVYHGDSISLGLIALDENQSPVLFRYSFDPAADNSLLQMKKREDRSYFPPVLACFRLPADYYRVNLQQLFIRNDDAARKQLQNYNLELQDIPVLLKPYIYHTENNYLSLSLEKQNADAPISQCPVLKSVSCHRDHITISARLKNSHSEDIRGAVLLYSSKIHDLRNPLKTVARQQGNDVIVTITIDRNLTTGLREYYWNLRIITDIFGFDEYLRIICPSFFKRNMFLFINAQMYTDDSHILFPYYRKDRSLSFTYRAVTEYDSARYKLREVFIFIVYVLLGRHWKKKNIRLIYEKYSRSAQDNSYYFFKYCMENLPEAEKKNIYYVIDKNSPDYENVRCYEPQVIQFMSVKHMLYALTMKIGISTDTYSHLYLWHSKPSLIYKKIASANNILFLQHGVTALKKVDMYFGKKGSNPVRYFVATSDLEKEIITKEFGYDGAHVPVVGFTRWDVLKDKSQKEHPMILLMPTWRSWLEDIDDDLFVKSEYYTKYVNLLTDPGLTKILDDYNVDLVLYLHPKFANYSKAFSSQMSTHISYVEFGQMPLNELIMQCSMLITDYSSVCWDVLYMHKPVLFYQFDYDQYITVHGSYINMKEDLPGERMESQEELISEIRTYISKGLQIDPVFDSKANKYFKFRDHKNSERTFAYLKEIDS